MRKLRNNELERLSVADFKNTPKTPLIVVLDNVRSLNNIGAIFRTCDAFLITQIYLCGITAKPPHKDIHKTALGSTDTVAWSYAKDTIDVLHALQNQSVVCCAVEQAEQATMLHDFKTATETKYAIVFGNEVKGVSQAVVDACDCVIEIPQFGTKHSLNISVSCGIVLWDIFNKLKM